MIRMAQRASMVARQVEASSSTGGDRPQTWTQRSSSARYLASFLEPGASETSVPCLVISHKRSVLRDIVKVLDLLWNSNLAVFP